MTVSFTARRRGPARRRATPPPALRGPPEIIVLLCHAATPGFALCKARGLQPVEDPTGSAKLLHGCSA